MNRRAFLLTTSAGIIGVPSFLHASEQAQLVAGPVRQQILPTEYGGPTDLLGFNGSVPGPELRVTQGETLKVDFLNDLAEGSAVHWHGVRLPNAMDGVPGMTQPLVLPGETFTYAFDPKDAGTFWYHSHHLSHEQVARGMMGPLVVEESAPPDVDHDITIVLGDWRLTAEGQLTDDFGNRHDIAHAGRMGNFARAFLPDLSLRQGERVRLRLINAAVDRIFPMIINGLDGRVVALDGMPLIEPRTYEQPMIAPAQRMDIIGDVKGTLKFEMAHRMGAYPLGEIPMQGTVPARADPVAALPPNDRPVAGEVSQTLSMTMKGGAMGGQHGGNGIWSFNDISGMAEAPFAKMALGQTATLDLINDTRWHHSIHLHGHHFYELDTEGTPGDLRDTTLINPQETRRILCTFDNPGRWMLHCHMLSHQAGGMKTWIEVG